MQSILQRYNTHKRYTLDRVTAKYANRSILLLGDFYREIADEMYEALQSGDSTLKISESRFPNLDEILEAHFKKVVQVGVSDGYLEISPEKKLGLWLQHDIYRPVEDCFTVKLAKRRDSIADIIEKRISDKRQDLFLETLSRSNSLKFLKEVYANLADGWLKGESTISEVKKALTETLGKNARSIETTFRTQTTDYFNQSRYEYFKTETSVTHIQIYAVTDGRTSEICESRDGFVVPIELAHFKRYMPPFHPNCRTVQRGLIQGLPSHDRLILRGEGMNQAAFKPLPKGWAA